MMKPALIALTASLVLATGSLLPATASAQPYGGQSYGQSHGGYGHGWHGGRHHKICKPILRKVRVQGHHGWRWKTIRVGERCYNTHHRYW